MLQVGGLWKVSWLQHRSKQAKASATRGKAKINSNLFRRSLQKRIFRNTKLDDFIQLHNYSSKYSFFFSISKWIPLSLHRPLLHLNLSVIIFLKIFFFVHSYEVKFYTQFGRQSYQHQFLLKTQKPFCFIIVRDNSLNLLHFPRL